MFFSLLITLIFAYGISNIKVIDTKKLNSLIIDKNSFLRFGLELPECYLHRELLDVNFNYIEYADFSLSDTSDEPLCMMDGKIVPYNSFINKNGMIYYEDELVNFTKKLNIDRRIKLKYLKPVFDYFNSIDELYFYIGVKPVGAKMPNSYYNKYFYRLGCYNFTNYAERNIQIDSSVKTYYIKCISNTIYVNNTPVAGDLVNYMENLLNTFEKTIFILQYNDETSIGDYIYAHSLCKKAIDIKRSDLSAYLFGDKDWQNLSLKNRQYIHKHFTHYFYAIHYP